MTKEEATQTIYGLILRSDEGEEGNYISSDEIEALEMAIEALKETLRKTARWVDGVCSGCGIEPPIDTVVDGFHEAIYKYGGKINYCPNCGAKMA